LRRVNAAGKHLLDLINEVLDLSKIEAGKLELNVEAVNLARLIDEVIGTAGQLAEKNQNRLIVEVAFPDFCEPWPPARQTTYLDFIRSRHTLQNALALLSYAAVCTPNCD